MAISVLQFPVDIPWRRVGVSMCMIDADVCDRRKPLEMLPSVAVFRYDPADESYYLGDDLAVSNLKVTCSITSYERPIYLIRNLRDVITARGAWRLSGSREGGLPEVMREHEPILIYLKERNPQAAAQAMNDHLTLTGNALLHKLEKEDEGSYERHWFEGVAVPPPVLPPPEH